MQDRINELREIFERRFCEIRGAEDLDKLRQYFLGKKGELTQILKTLGTLGQEERKSFGQRVNELRVYVENTLEEAWRNEEQYAVAASLLDETLDTTMPGRRRALGHRHPITIVLEEMKALFLGMGFTIAEGPEIESDYYNFEALNIPANHPVKDEQDTFYVNEQFLLRTQTSPVQIRVMERQQPPIRIIAPGKVYRSDDWDATHAPVFHQIEGLLVDRDITMGDLKGLLILFVGKIMGDDVQVRFRPSFFPFTEPSAEMDVRCYACHGKADGCRVCKDTGWVELLGCGMVHPNVLRMSGIDPDVYSGWAFGMGIDRIAAQRFNIPDLRLLFENDIQFLSQF